MRAVAVLSLACFAALAAGCGSSSPDGSAATAPAAGSAGAATTLDAPAPRRRKHDVLVIGDSLAVGFEPALKAALPGWRVRVDGRIGRPLAEGMRILAGQTSTPAILAFSLFTNDDPRETPALEAAVRATATRPGGCAVWATVVRPPLAGVSYDAANALLRGLANDPELALRLVDWAAAVARSPSLLARDGVHGTPAGYRALGRLYAAAVASCAG
jgi:lysophospholipase L1-like esterase